MLLHLLLVDGESSSPALIPLPTLLELLLTFSTPLQAANPPKVTEKQTYKWALFSYKKTQVNTLKAAMGLEKRYRHTNPLKIVAKNKSEVNHIHE